MNHKKLRRLYVEERLQVRRGGTQSLGIDCAMSILASPQQNAFIESFNGCLGGEFLNDTAVHLAQPGSAELTAWQRGLQHERPHSSLAILRRPLVQVASPPLRNRPRRCARSGLRVVSQVVV